MTGPQYLDVTALPVAANRENDAMPSHRDDGPDALDALRRAGVEFQVHHHPPARRADELHLTGLDIAMSAKTLAFRLRDGRIALAAIPGLGRLRYPKLAAALGVARSALTPAIADDLAELGMAPGGVAPFTVAPHAVLVIERSVLALPVLYCGGGSSEISIELSPADLLRAMPTAILADLCADELLPD